MEVLLIKLVTFLLFSWFLIFISKDGVLKTSKAVDVFFTVIVLAGMAFAVIFMPSTRPGFSLGSCIGIFILSIGMVGRINIRI